MSSCELTRSLLLCAFLAGADLSSKLREALALAAQLRRPGDRTAGGQATPVSPDLAAGALCCCCRALWLAAGHRTAKPVQHLGRWAGAEFSSLCRETLTLAAQLRLPGEQTAESQAQAVEDLIQRLGLTGSADTIVGNAKTRCVAAHAAASAAQALMVFCMRRHAADA